MSSLANSPERKIELSTSLAEIKATVLKESTGEATLVAVSKYKPAADIFTCYEDGHRVFGENYVQELQEKAVLLPRDIRWHFIGPLQSNKAKILASIPNMDTIQTLTSAKTATALDKYLLGDRTELLKILIQVNTSGESAKNGVAPISHEMDATSLHESELCKLASHIVKSCPRLRLEGVMTIGALAQSLEASESDENSDFETLKETRDALSQYLTGQFGSDGWGRSGKLLLSMGMSSDFRVALHAGSDIVRVGTGIFGARNLK